MKPIVVKENVMIVMVVLQDFRGFSSRLLGDTMCMNNTAIWRRELVL